MTNVTDFLLSSPLKQHTMNEKTEINTSTAEFTRLAAGEILKDNKGRQWVVIDRHLPAGADGPSAYCIALMEQGDSQVHEVSAEMLNRWLSNGTMNYLKLSGWERVMRRWYG